LEALDQLVSSPMDEGGTSPPHSAGGVGTAESDYEESDWEDSLAHSTANSPTLSPHSPQYTTDGPASSPSPPAHRRAGPASGRPPVGLRLIDLDGSFEDQMTDPDVESPGRKLEMGEEYEDYERTLKDYKASYDKGYEGESEVDEDGGDGEDEPSSTSSALPSPAVLPTSTDGGVGLDPTYSDFLLDLINGRSTPVLCTAKLRCLLRIWLHLSLVPEEEDDRTDVDYNYDQDIEQNPIKQDDLVVQDSDALAITRTTQSPTPR